jgi:hypothetical protein
MFTAGPPSKRLSIVVPVDGRFCNQIEERHSGA